MKRISLLFLIALFAGSVFAGNRLSFNEGWLFKLGDQLGAETSDFNESSWRHLNLPHDWSIEGEYSKDNPMGDRGGYLPAGIGWYRKTIAVPAEWKGKHVEIAFDGVFMNSTVWVNGRKLGFRPYGKISFNYDISNDVQRADSLIFAVRVDNEKQPAARWYAGSGIYANTWIDVKEKLHVPTSGVFVRTEGSTVKIDTEVTNTFTGSRKGTLKTSIRNSEGDIVATVQNKINVDEGETKTYSQSIQLDNPELWSLETPYLYNAVSEILVDNKTQNRVVTRFGVRDIEWIPETGMWLNGKNIKLRGVCNHQDAGALGVAVPDKILRFRIQQLKNMGINAIRTAHNPQTPEFYDMCDEMGVLVMDEIFDGWLKKAANDYGAHSFDEWWYRDLSDWIKRDRNHPSVVIYSVGNETRGPVGKDLVERCHELDPTRPVTSGHSASEHMDVFGVNGTSERKDWLENLKTDRVFIGTENTHTWQVRGFYRTKTWYRDGYNNNFFYYPDLTEEEVFHYDWANSSDKNNAKQIFNSSYDNAMVRLVSRQNIELLRDTPHFAGSFRWTGYDYIGEAGYVHGGWPFKSFMGGAIDMANFPKDLYYLYQSQWTDKPMVHILPHWTHPTLTEGTEIPVWVYSNCDEVELFFNGKSLGKQTPGLKWDEMQCEWMVGWQAGTLEAVGYKNGEVVTKERIRTADAPSQIELTVDGKPLSDKGKDIVQVRVTTRDAKGEFYPYGENRTYFHLLGPAKIRALDNGSPIDVEKHFEATDRIAFFGLTRAYIESGIEEGDVSLIAGSILGEKKQVTSKKVSVDVQQLNLRGDAPVENFKTYYTTDGTVPTEQSALYKEPFEIELGTTVKALVTVGGNPVLKMEERFAKDEGFVWNSESSKTDASAGNQAEDATFEGSVLATIVEGYYGNGYLSFDGSSNGFVEWYQENDGSEGAFNLKIRYTIDNRASKQHKVKLTVNGKDEVLTWPATKNNQKAWKVFETEVQLNAGANYIRLSPLEGEGLCIDEMIIE